MPKIRLVVADDHAILRAGLRMLIDAQADMQVVGEAANGREALSQSRHLKPDVLLLDITMPGPRVVQTIRQVVAACPSSRVLVLTMHDDVAYFRSTMTAGASGYVVKKAADAELLSAIRAVHRGRTFVDLSGRDDGHGPGAPGATASSRAISTRERQVLQLLAQGHTNQEVADLMAVSIKTVETYRARLTEKLGLRSRAELYRFAVETGMVTPAGPRRRGPGP